MNPPFDPTPTSDEIAEANQTVAQTPVTLPLKRPTPVFVEATLPPEPAAPEPTALEPAALEPVVPAEAASLPVEAAAPSPDTAAIPADAAATENSNAVSPPSAPLPAVEFSPPPGPPVQGSLTLRLVSSPEIEIRYALNAADVGADGLLYDPAQKIFLAQSTSVAARTVMGGQLGPLATAQFGIVQPAWQKIEPLDQSDPTPHEIGEQVALEGRWRLGAASTRGKLHAHRGLWREDSLAYGLAPAADGSYAITIVSDGAGSANLSRVGSKLLCAAALEHLQAKLTGLPPLADDQATLVSRDLPPLRALLVEAASLALQKLREEAARRGKPLSDFSSTLLILVRREWQGAQLCAALQAGDGSIALWDEGDTLTILGEADHGQHSSETKFLTTSGMEAELPARVKFSIRPRLRAALVMSDGIADDFFPETARFPDLIRQVLPLVEADAENAGAALLKWMGYEKKGSSDDRALIISWRDATPAAQIESAADATLDALTNVPPPAAVSPAAVSPAAVSPAAVSPAAVSPAVAEAPSPSDVATDVAVGTEESATASATPEGAAMQTASEPVVQTSVPTTLEPENIARVGGEEAATSETILSQSASLGTASLGTASLGTASLGTASLGTASLGTASLGTASLGTASLGTASPEAAMPHEMADAVPAVVPPPETLEVSETATVGSAPLLSVSGASGETAPVAPQAAPATQTASQGATDGEMRDGEQ